MAEHESFGSIYDGRFGSALLWRKRALFRLLGTREGLGVIIGS
jgi:hypothetical protein